MGPKQSKPHSPTAMPEIEFEHPRLRSSKFIKTPQNELMLECMTPIANAKQYEDWLKQLSQSPTQKGYLYLPLKVEQGKEGFCGASSFAKVGYEGQFYLSFEGEVKNRVKINKQFQEGQIWYLMLVLLQAAKGFHSKHRKLGDIRPQNILMNQDGQIKVISQLSFLGEQTNYQKTYYNGEQTYLSPEELRDIAFSRPQQTCDPLKGESFSVGLTCLDAIILQDSRQLYGEKNKFNTNLLERKLQKMSQSGYSKNLCAIIRNLCNIQPQKRIYCNDLHFWLKPYQQKILNFQKLPIPQLPQPIKSQLALKYSKCQSQNPPLVQTSQVKKFQNPEQTQPNSTQKAKPQIFSTEFQIPRQINASSKFYKDAFQKNYKIVDSKQRTRTDAKGSQNQVDGSKYQYSNKNVNVYKVGYGGHGRENEELFQLVDRQLEKSRKLFPSS